MRYIIEKTSGRRRPAGKVICLGCNEEFLKSIYHINKTGKHYCSRECYINSTKGLVVKCSYCNKDTYKQKNKLNNTKSGHFFCSRECQNKGKTISFGLTEVQPSFYNNGINYRDRAFRILDNKCSVCGYDVKEVLEVHHKDCDRENNDSTNWDILCPNHHKEYQLGIRKYVEE